MAYQFDTINLYPEGMTVESAGLESLRWWLNVPEWEPYTAAYLLLGLDPDDTYPDKGSYAWMPCSRPDDDPALSGLGDRYSFELNMLARWERMIRIVSAANAALVRTPFQWIIWAQSVKIEPPWLRLATEAGLLAEPPALPDQLPTGTDDAPAAHPSVSSSDVDTPSSSHTAANLGPETDRHFKMSSRGGKQKAEKHRPIWEFINPRIDEWIKAGEPGTQAGLAGNLEALLTSEENRSWYRDISIEYDTIRRHVGKYRKKKQR